MIFGFAEIWHFVVIATVVGAADSFFGPALTGLIPQTVSRDRLQEANALIGLSRSGSSIVGPAAAGVIVALAGAGWVLAADAGDLRGQRLFLSRLRVTRHETLQRRRCSLLDSTAGWREVRSRDWVWASLLGFGFGNLGWGVQNILGLLVARNELGGPEAWGFIAGASGIGGLLGGLVRFSSAPFADPAHEHGRRPSRWRCTSPRSRSRRRSPY